MNEVPEPSERWTTAIAWFGSFAPGFSFEIAASFQRVILPWKMPESVALSSVREPEGTPGRL